MVDFLRVGKLVNTHALRGEVRVISHSDFKDARFKKGSELVIDAGGTHVPVVVENARVNKNFDLLKFVGMDHINDVEKYKGCEILVKADDLEALEGDEFYYFEVIGCAVRTLEEVVLGEIVDILQTGANDVWVVKRKGEKDLLIPYIHDVVKDVNIVDKVVTIELLEGLV